MKFSEWMTEKDVEEWLDSLTEEELKEAMEKKFDYTDTTKGLIGKWTFFSDKGNRYEVTIVEIYKSVYSVTFVYVDPDGNTTTSLTNLRDNATAILNSVYEIVEKEAVKKHHPKEIRFEAQGEKRQRVYDVVLRRYINDRMKKHGYELSIEKHDELPMKVYKYVRKEQ